MPTADIVGVDWLGLACQTLERYREELLRRVASKLIRPRSNWSPDELRERMAAALDDPVGIDRTIKPLSPIARQLLRLIGLSGQPRWPLQPLADLLPALDYHEGIGPVVELLEAGLIFPELEGTLPIESFEAWLVHAGTVPRTIFAVPLVAERCRTELLDINAPTGEKLPKIAGNEPDGLELLLRLAVLWQTVREAPLRLTQAGGFFKRDLDRLRGHSLLASPFADSSVAIADPAMFAVELGRATGVLTVDDDQLLAGALPASWLNGIGPVIAELWSALFAINTWDPIDGYGAPPSVSSWLRPAGILVAAALQSLPDGHWLSVTELADWLVHRQPDWQKSAEQFGPWCEAFLLGLLHPLRLVESNRGPNSWLVRLTSLGRAIFAGGDAVAAPPSITQTLLVQPNLEMILYRQGLSPALVGQLTRIAEWKVLGLACTLTLTADSVYRGLESGLSLIEIQRVLERHSTRPLSDSVLETLRSWASKRERVQVYPSAVLLEFRTPLELEQALKQGLIEIKITDRIGLVSGEGQIDYSRFRLVGSRDYQSPDERCVEIGDDGLTLLINDGKADLLFGAEVRRFSDAMEPASDDRSRFRLSLESLRRARQSGTDLRWLDDWFARRAGAPTPPTARLLFLGRDVPGMILQQMVVLRTTSPDIADGIANWPAAAALIAERLGPTTFAVSADDVSKLRTLLLAAELQIDGDS